MYHRQRRVHNVLFFGYEPKCRAENRWITLMGYRFDRSPGEFGMGRIPKFHLDVCFADFILVRRRKGGV